jgi:hypothetical protein
MEVKARIKIVDTDTVISFGHGSVNCISPPEELYPTAEVQVTIDVGKLGIDGISTLTEFDVTGWSMLGNQITIDFQLTGEMISRVGGIYER